MNINSFITGSRAYGRPKTNSDVDLVCLVDQETANLLLDFSDERRVPIRYGNLNLILTTDKEAFMLWKKCTDHLSKQDFPVDKQSATEYIEAEFAKAGKKRFLCNSGDSIK